MSDLTAGVIIGNRDFFPDQLVSEARTEINTILEETYKSAGFRAALNVTADALSKISEKPHLWSLTIMQLYLLAENREKSLYWLEKMYIRKDPNLPYYAIIGPGTKRYQNEPRYIEIMERINLR